MDRSKSAHPSPSVWSIMPRQRKESPINLRESGEHDSNMRNFPSPHPLLDCVARLQHLAIGNSILFSSRVEVVRSDDYSYDFELRRWEYLNHLATIHGSLIYDDEQTTRVTYKVDYSLRLFTVVVLYFAFIIFGFISDLINQRYQSIPVIGIFALWGLLVIAWVDYLVRKFVKSMKNVLG
jgi:hypothetical protein